MTDQSRFCFEDGTLWLRCDVGACFAEERLELRLELCSDYGELHANVSGYGCSLPPKGEALIPREDAEAFVTRILGIVGREQVLYGERATIYWSLSLRWDLGDNRGEVEATNRDGDRRMLEDLLRGSNPQMKQRLQEILALGLHQWPQEAYAATREFLCSVPDLEA